MIIVDNCELKRAFSILNSCDDLKFQMIIVLI